MDPAALFSGQGRREFVQFTMQLLQVPLQNLSKQGEMIRQLPGQDSFFESPAGGEFILTKNNEMAW